MKKVYLTLTVLFGVLSFAGAGHVLCTGGNANAGYGVIPMLFCIIFLRGYLSQKQKEDK